MILRPYQQKIVDDVRALMKAGARRILIVAPCGAGKTALTTHMLGSASSKGLHSQFIVHRRELLKQSVEAFAQSGITTGVISAGFVEDKRPLIQVASIYSLTKRFKKYPKPTLCYWDESQYTGAKTWDSMISAYPDAFHIGLTATPCRLDGKPLGKHFYHMVVGPTMRELIDQGYLSDYKLYSSKVKLDTTGIKTSMGDFDKAQVEVLMDKPTITGNAILEYNKLCSNKRALVFCVSIKHSENVAAQFNANGIPAIHLDGTTPSAVRDKALKDLKEGRLKVISNVNLFSEGLNIPEIECVILLRPTQSLALYIQQTGRAMRVYPGKTHAIILDHAGNVFRHGFPDDERVWSLTGSMKKKKSEDGTVRVKTCGVCYAVQPPAQLQCAYCGNLFEKQAREVQEVDGDLHELTRDQLKKRAAKAAQGNAQTMEDLIALAKSRNYKSPYAWAKFVFNGRQARKLRG